MRELTIEIGSQELVLGDRYLSKGDDLLLADLHFGKTMHFRKAGMPMPPQARDADQSAFLRLLNEKLPRRVILLGDLFHSEHNIEVDEVSMITSQFPSIDFVLVKGNHDVMEDAIYRTMDMVTCDVMDWHGFVLSHEPLAKTGDSAINIHGHIHPGIVLRGKGRQRIKIPCFHFDGNRLCLPAFGALTGLMRIRPKRSDRIFGITSDGVSELKIDPS